MNSNQFADLIQQAYNAGLAVAPKALHLAIQMKRWECVGTLGLGLALVLIGLILVKLYRVIIAANTGPSQGFWDLIESDEGPLWFFGAWVPAIPIIWGLVLFLDPWYWIGAFYPQVALFHDAVSKLLSH